MTKDRFSKFSPTEKAMIYAAFKAYELFLAEQLISRVKKDLKSKDPDVLRQSSLALEDFLEVIDKYEPEWQQQIKNSKTQ